MKVVFREATPGLDQNSFAAQPKTIWRLGKDYGRLQEMPDVANGVHGLIVVNGQDSWIANLMDKSGYHVVDRASGSGFHAPMISGVEVPPAVAELEFGCEFEYMRSRSVQPEMVKIDDKDFRQYRATVDRYVLRLIALPDKDVPVGFELLVDGAVEYYFQYVEYGTNLEPDPRLFTKPDGVSFVEG